jgi:general secretion pathway protein G
MLTIHTAPFSRVAPARKWRARGFTLIELLVVIAIIALLASIVGPQVMGRLGTARSQTAGVQIADIEKSLDLFKLDVGRYPTNDEGLQALVSKPGTASQWAGPYLKSGLPKDPWGEAYKYANPGPKGGVEILTLGADKAPGGEGENADVRNQQ